MLRNFMILALLSTLLGCGDHKPGFFSASGYHIGRDKVWYKTSTGASFQVSEVLGADPKTFAVRELSSKIFAGATAFYGQDHASVFWASHRIEGADLASFEYLFSDYSRDKNWIYYMAQRLTDDLAHFAVVDRQFVKDGKAVYFGNRVFSEDPAHFEVVGGDGSGYFKDSKNCWYGIYPIKEADVATFHHLGPRTAADKRRVYQEMNEVEGADIETYQILEHGFAKDSRSVYLQSVRMDDVHPASFRVLSEHYSLDDRHCYYYMTALPEADPATFHRIDEFYTKDARRVYSLGNLIEGADPATFRVLNGAAGCSCDAQHAYTMEKRIDGVNPKGFPATGECKSCNESSVSF